MSRLNQTTRQHVGNSWPNIAATAVMQLAVLLVLYGAFVCWLNWSSAAAVAEFMATTPSVAAPGEPHASIPLRPAHHRTATCARRA